MRQLHLYGNESYFLSAQIALDAHRIPYTALHSAGDGGLVLGSSGCLLVDDDDYERACEAIAELQDSGSPRLDEAYSNPIFRILLHAIVSGIVVLWLSIVLHNRG